MKNILFSDFPSTNAKKMEQLLSCAYSLNSPESKAIGLPDFPVDNLQYTAKILVRQFNKVLLKFSDNFQQFCPILRKITKFYQKLPNITKKYQILPKINK